MCLKARLDGKQWRTQDFVKGGAKPDENIADDKKKNPVGVGSLTVFG